MGGSDSEETSRQGEDRGLGAAGDTQEGPRGVGAGGSAWREEGPILEQRGKGNLQAAHGERGSLKHVSTVNSGK